MAVLIPRTRSISVRLSDQEFADLQRFCAANGLRSISDLTRNAICGLLNHSDQSDVNSTALAYAAQIKGLEQKVERLAMEVESFKSKKKFAAKRAAGNNHPDSMEPPESR
jgi:hypothetical protein